MGFSNLSAQDGLLQSLPEGDHDEPVKSRPAVEERKGPSPDQLSGKPRLISAFAEAVFAYILHRKIASNAHNQARFVGIQ